jgi:excisionase family DNA binding protein
MGYKANISNRYLTLTEAASFLRLSVTTLSKLIKSGKIKSYSTGKKFLLLIEDLEKFLSENTKEVVNG